MYATMSSIGRLLVDLVLSGETRGDLIRKGSSAWERLAAATSGRVVCGDGTDVISAPMTGVISGSVAGGNFVTALASGYDTLRKGSVHLTATGSGGDGAIVGTGAGSLGNASGITVATIAAGKVALPILMAAAYKFSGEAYAGGSSLELDLGSGALAGLISISNLATSATNKQGACEYAWANSGDFSGDLAIRCSSPYTQPGSAAGTLDVTVWYFEVGA